MSVSTVAPPRALLFRRRPHTSRSHDRGAGSLAARLRKAAPEEAAFGVVVGEGQGAIVLRGGLRATAQAAQQIRARGRQQVIAGEFAACRQVVQESEARRRPLRLSHGHSPVQFHYRRRVDSGQRLVERRYRRPVGRSPLDGSSMLRGNRRLEEVPPDGRVR